MALKQLPGSGDWITPAYITEVSLRKADVERGVPPRVIVVTISEARQVTYRTIDCMTEIEAAAIRDEIAGWCDDAEPESTDEDRETVT